MTSEAVKLARIREKAQFRRDFLEIVKNPVIEILLGYLVIEYLQTIPINRTAEQLRRIGRDERSDIAIIPAKAGTIAEAGILAAVALQQLAPLSPALAAGSEASGKVLSGLIGTATKAAPLAAIIP